MAGLAAANVDSPQGTVLIVEDQPLIASLLQTMLEELRFTGIIIADNVESAMAVAGGQSFGLALLDINVGGKDVYPIADALRSAGTPVVFTTGYRRGDIRSDWKNAPILEKPFTLQQLAAALGELGLSLD